MKILLPIDGSEYTKRMLGYVAAHDELLGNAHDYTLFTAVPAIPPHAARYLDHKLLDEYYSEQAEAVFRPVRVFAEQHGWRTSFVHAVGRAAESIAELTETLKPELIVMGTHGHSALGNIVLGSVATGVLARCKAPVLLIR